MAAYLTYELTANGIKQVENTECRCFIMHSDIEVLKDKTFVDGYIEKYGPYIGVLVPRSTFDSNMKGNEDNQGILAFL